MIITSLKSTTEIRSLHQTFFPTNVLVEQLHHRLQFLRFPHLCRQHLVVGIISTIGTLITTIFAAFAFAPLNFRGKNVIFAILLATMMIPGEMMVITNYITVAAYRGLARRAAVMAGSPIRIRSSLR
jgi:multiple sugar transport system permease protein